MTMQPYRDAGVRCLDTPRVSCAQPPARRKWLPLAAGLGVAVAFATGVATASVGASRGRIEIDSSAFVRATKKKAPVVTAGQSNAHAWIRGHHDPNTLTDRALTLQEMGLDVTVVTVRGSAFGVVGFEDGDQILGVDGYTVDDNYAGYKPIAWSVVEILRRGHHIVFSIHDAIQR